jgi:hypothetical protein
VPQAKLLEITQILFDNLPMQKIIRAKKSLGQNFLIDNEALFDISDSLIISEKHIIEVGPGYGATKNTRSGRARSRYDSDTRRTSSDRMEATTLMMKRR